MAEKKKKKQVFICELSDVKQTNMLIERVITDTTSFNQQLIKDYCGFLRRNGRTEATLVNNLNFVFKELILFNPEKDFCLYSKVDFESFIDNLLIKSPASTTKSVKLTHLCSVIKWIDEYIKENPDYSKKNLRKKESPVSLAWLDIPKSKSRVKKLNTDAEIKTVLGYTHVRDSCLLAILWESGPRIRSELLKVQIKDIIKRDNTIQINLQNSKTQGGKRPIFVVLSIPYIVKLLETHSSKHDPEAYLFCNLGVKRFGKKATYIGVYLSIAKAFKKAQVPFYGFHSLRHLAVTRDSQRGMGDRMLVKKYGWSATSNQPANYSHLTKEDLEKSALKNAGIVIKDAEEEGFLLLKPKHCKTCGKICPGNLDSCDACGKAFNKDTEMLNEMQKQIKALQHKVFLERNQIEKIEDIPTGHVLGCTLDDGTPIRAYKNGWIE